MTFVFRVSRRPAFALAVVGVLLPTLALAAGRLKKVPKPGQFNRDHQTVEMFGAIDKGDIDVKLIPKDSTECRVLIRNKTDKPLNVKLPDAFAGVPVLAQPGVGGGVGGGAGGQGFGGGMGGMGGMGGGMGMGGMGGGFFNVPPEKVGKLKVTTVCLEHGKPDPRPAMKYEIKPIASFTDKPAVHEMLNLLGRGKVDQRAAQVAAWHLNDEMSFQELAAKVIRRANGVTRPYFTPQELRSGMRVSAASIQLAEQRKADSGRSDSLSRK